MSNRDQVRDQILIKYNLILIEGDNKNTKTNVGKFQECTFIGINKKNVKRRGGGGGFGYREGGVGHRGGGVLPTIGPLSLKNIIVETENNLP